MQKIKKIGAFEPLDHLIKVLRIEHRQMKKTRYIRKIYRFKNAIEIEEHRDAGHGAPGKKRKEKEKPTREQVEKVNQYVKEKRARHRLRTYFKTEDYFTTLTYRIEERPESMETAKKQFTNFINKVRREYRKRGAALYWMRNIEVGTKNGWHVHLIVNRIQDTDIILKRAWPYGRVISELLYEKGEFAKLAAYITKTSKTDPRLRESSYAPSRNMPLPEPEVRYYKRWKNWRKVNIPEGYYLDEDSFFEGVNPITEFMFRRCTLLKIRRE